MIPIRKTITMRKNFIFGILALAIAGGIASGCSQQPIPETLTEDPVDVDAVIEPGTTVDGIVLSVGLPKNEDETKTSLGAPQDGVYQILWSAGDKISINGTESSALSSGGTKEAEFTVEGELTAPFNVIYPGTTSANKVTIPVSQTYVAGSFPAGSAPAYGVATKRGDKYSVKLNGFCGILRLALNGSATLTKIELKSKGSEKVCGEFTLNSFAPGASFTGGSNGAITINLGSLTLSSADTYIYLPVPAQAYASGLEALVYQADGAFMRLTFLSGQTVSGDKVIEFESKTFAAGRTENLFAAGSLTAEEGTASATIINVGVYNLYAQSSRKKDYMSLENSNVRAALGEAVNKMGADIIGFNEIDSNFLNDGSYSIKTLSGLSGYAWELNHPDDIKDEGWLIPSYVTSCKFADGFAYKTSMFSITDHNYVWISHTSDNTYYDSRSDAYHNSGSPETTCAYAKFTHTTSGKQFYVFVTHTSTTDHLGSEVGATEPYDKEDELIVARRGRIVNNLKYFCNQKAGSLPYIVMGDFNFGPYYDTKKTRTCAAYTSMTSGGLTNAYDEVYAAGNLSDIYVNYPGTQTGSNWGAHYMTNLKYPQFRIDHIWLKDGSSQNISAETYKTVRVTYDVTTSVPIVDEETGDPTGEYESVTNTWCPSDHFPVVAQILFE